jgi:hypothetical protein
MDYLDKPSPSLNVIKSTGIQFRIPVDSRSWRNAEKLTAIKAAMNAPCDHDPAL